MTTGQTRPYRSRLREQQAEQTRRMILEAVAELVAVEGVVDFSMGDVAQKAGVALATLYRYFPNRQALMDGMTNFATEQMRSSGVLSSVPKKADDLPQYVKDGATAFEHVRPLSSASAIIALTSGLRSAAFKQRSEQLRVTLEDRLAHLPSDHADAAFGMLRHLVSHLSWMVLHDQLDLREGAAGRATAWAVRVLLDDLARGGGPHQENSA